MTIKEIEGTLGISRAAIRFYEKQSLITPKRQNNEYRDYSQEDVLRLKQIIMLRKIGFSIEEIRELLNNDALLDQMAEQKIQGLQVQKQELDGAIALCTEIASSHLTMNQLDEQYWNEILQQENSGHRFMDAILTDSKLAMYQMASDIEYSPSTGPRTPTLMWNPFHKGTEQINSFWAEHPLLHILLMIVFFVLCLFLVLRISGMI